MPDITIDDLLELGRSTVVKEFYLPIDDTVDNFDEAWLKNIVLGTGSSEEKIKAIKSHECIGSGNIIAAELEKLGLQFLFYADKDEKPLKDFNELVFVTGGSVTDRKRLHQIDSGFISELKQTLLYDKVNKGYIREPIDPSLAEIEQIGNFNVNSFGPNKHLNDRYQKMNASKTFEYENGEANLEYSASLNPEGVIDEFNISLEITSGKEKGPSDFLARIDVKNIDGKYVPKAEVRVKSKRAKQLGSSYGLVSYHFDSDGQFDYIKLLGSELVFNRKNIKNMGELYAKLEGVVWHNDKYYLKINDKLADGEIKALLTRDGIEHHATSSLNNGDLVLEEEYDLVPIVNLAAAPGLTNDLLTIQYYKQLAEEFSQIGFFKNSPIETAGIDYVHAIKTLANIQNMPAYEVPLLL